jgi:hypothetical protein
MNISISLLSHVEFIECLFECDGKTRIQPQPQQNAIESQNKKKYNKTRIYSL